MSSARSAQKFGGKNKTISKNRTLKSSIKNFKGFRRVRKSIETSGDISGSEVVNPLQNGPECTLGDLGLLILKEMCSSLFTI